MLTSKDTDRTTHLPPEPHPKIFAPASEHLVDRADTPYVTREIGRISWVPIVATRFGNVSTPWDKSKE